MRKFKSFLLLTALPSAAIFASPAMADEYIQLSTGIDYSSGDYGDTVDTDFLAIPLTIKYQAENFYLRASTSWVDVKGPSGFIPGDGGVTVGTPGGQLVSRSGLGDVNLTAGYSFFLGGSTFFDVVGKVKLPTLFQFYAMLSPELTVITGMLAAVLVGYFGWLRGIRAIQPSVQTSAT